MNKEVEIGRISYTRFGWAAVELDGEAFTVRRYGVRIGLYIGHDDIQVGLWLGRNSAGYPEWHFRSDFYYGFDGKTIYLT